MTARQRAFIAYYCGSAKFCGSEAARRAGYGGDDNALAVTASKLLRHPKVKAEVERRMGRLASAETMAAEDVVRQLTLIARTTIDDYMDIERDVDTATGRVIERAVVNLAKAKALESLGAIRSVKAMPDGRIEVTPYSRLAALELLSKVHGLLREKVVVEQGSDEAELRADIMARLARLTAPPSAN